MLWSESTHPSKKTLHGWVAEASLDSKGTLNFAGKKVPVMTMETHWHLMETMMEVG
jgi:hypothetical protein